MPDATVKLVRETLRPALSETTSAHPGLLLQKGWADFVKTTSENAGANGKTEHIRRICNIPCEDTYRNAFKRWQKATSDSGRFAQVAMKIDGRMLIGLTGGGALETGCAVSHTYGMPYIPGSSIKGCIRAWATEHYTDKFGTELDEIFGKGELSGIVTFHDAWWIPDSGTGPEMNKPFVEEIVTPHHVDYYTSNGEKPATDLDSPVPNAMIGVRGSFLFVIEGDPAWLSLAEPMLKKALADHGIGAKTRAGYGYFVFNEEYTNRILSEANQSRIAALPTNERLIEEAKALTEKQISELFGSDITKTKETYGDNFELFAKLVKELKICFIDSWQNETRKTSKPRWKAYRFFADLPLIE